MTAPADRIAEAFARARAENRAALVGYLMAGDPTPAASLGAFRALADGGADLVEIGVPFSDPIADGPVIQSAGERALRAHMTLRGALELLRELGPGFPPAVVMTYANPIRSLGEAAFAESLARAGGCGAIVPDLPLEESASLGRELGERGLALVQLAAPTTPPARLAAIAKGSRGFLYYVSLEGVTGRTNALPADLATRLAEVRSASGALPVAVGFGVATAADASRLAVHADGIVVGSSLVRANAERGASGVAALARELRAATRREAARR